MLIYACCVLPVVSAQYVGGSSMWLALLVIGLAMSAHQAWSANIYTTVSDMFPKNATATVTGIGGMCGALGGMLIAKLAGKLFDHYKLTAEPKTGYLIMFLICSVAYLAAWIIMQLLAPKMKKVGE